MNDLCKLLYVTVALKKDEMPEGYLGAPNEYLTGMRVGTKGSVMVTFGLHAKPEEPVGMYFSVSPMGKEPPIEQTQYSDITCETLRASLLPNGMGLFQMTIEIKDVLFNDGIYEANVRLFPSGEKPGESRQIDAIKSYFYVLTLKERNHVINS
ncbi:TPA: hypothetical protein L9K99_001078 [Klebsiella quasipneumoniae subsp. similipneumoniae]|nr:hypothetical protein [Klebsiella quasipneumoniae]HBR1176930.1 hypothetical protein [Klebsiella quasipneumoniae subsp. similipneumoniae]